LRGVRRLYFRLVRLAGRVTAPYGLTGMQYLSLLFIVNNPGLIQRQLAEELDSDPNTISSVLARLRAKGLVERVRRPSDRRALGVFATRQGREKVRRIRRQIDRLSLELVRNLPEGEAGEIDRWLENCSSIE
jgi:DNA-binding MarR family transcriptional regulator